MPHLRYGALAYVQNKKRKKESGVKVDTGTYEAIAEYKKIYNASFKHLFRMGKNTPHRIIDAIMDSWSTEAVAI